ncbi:polysaccharide pyruvyl transferase family protein [Butyrivibrio sp. ob235]|uniref:polysaccharide pyruvyl transferase family protein n=1 Tax=Butyrivibrio sp. ob235 TaxID=1761780 RepID=UPI001113B4C5|nr:polysaccharide pyruvyl transferase family protein [Butyrivibrio sp. ob235]
MKKKAIIITRHAISNYGSLLQSIATERVFENKGYECEILDYIRKDEYKSNSLLTAGKTKKYVKRCPPLLFAYYIARYKEYLIASKRFDDMRKKWLKTTALYHTLDNVPDADVYVSGSDQVWGPLLGNEYDWNYFLKFVSDDVKKIAFASSFGKMAIEKDVKEVMVKLFLRYDYISVREKQAVDFLKSTGIEAKQILDPTLFLSGDEWRDMVGSEKKSSKGKYVLVYQIHRNKDLCIYAEKVAEKLDLPLIRVSAMKHQKNWGGKFVLAPDLKDFIEYIDNATYIVTDSFHGTAFSINLNTPFTTLMPRTGTSSRNVSLLELVGLTSQIAQNVNDLHMLDCEIDFTLCNKKLNEERIKSNLIVDEMLKI